MRVSSEKSIFLSALERESPDEREAYLDEACGDDAKLRSSVEALLAAHEREDNPLDASPAELMSHLGETWDENGPPGAGPMTSSIAEGPGTVVGPYKLMEKIGEGGFGLVFVAQQMQPVRRKVALKVIKPGMDTRDVVARFEAERQALAMMDHPNIARVFDAGSTETGRPYFVMELVRGIPITEFCEQRDLGTRERLELFVMVCRGVQHAHQKGVIHRDLKPSNVLVTLHDGTPVVKVIDFGVAKAIGQSLTEKTIYTRFTAMIGTPLYMSPEQAEMSGLDVDTRSDIYSLGMLLYELLTGTTPFDEQRLEKASLDELRRIIREEEPPRPSTRLTTPGDALSTLAAPRRLEPEKLSVQMRGDLDWVVMKAIEKDRTRRYETASALAADVERYLRSEPVEARPPSKLYRLRKFVLRRKATITTATLVLAAMIFGTGISIWQAARAVAERNEKIEALNAAVQARNEAEQAKLQVEQFTERLKQATVLLTSGRAQADADNWAAANLDYSQAVELQPNYYQVWVERGLMYARLGLWDRAADDFTTAFDLAAPASGPAWTGVPAILRYTGNERLGSEVSSEMMKLAEESSEGISWNAIRSCLIAPPPETDFAALADWAEMLLHEQPGGSPPPPHGGPPPRDGRPPRRRGERPPGMRPPPGPGPNGDFAIGDDPHRRGSRGYNHLPRGASLYLTGWAQYLAGNYERAIELLERSNSADPGWPASGLAYPLLAMAYQQSGHEVDARAAHSRAERLFDQWTEEMLQLPVGEMPFPWFDWVEYLTLYREATALISGSAPSDDSRLQALQAKASSAIEAVEPTVQP